MAAAERAKLAKEGDLVFAEKVARPDDDVSEELSDVELKSLRHAPLIPGYPQTVDDVRVYFERCEVGGFRALARDVALALVENLDRATERAEKAEERNKAIGEAMRQMIGLRNTYAVLERADSPEAD